MEFKNKMLERLHNKAEVHLSDHFFERTEYALFFAQKIMEEMACDREVVLASCMLIETGWRFVKSGLFDLSYKEWGNREKRERLWAIHAAYSREIAKNLLFDVSFPADKKAEVLSIITHHTKNNPHSKEAQVVCDAKNMWGLTKKGFYFDANKRGVPPKKHLEDVKKELRGAFKTHAGHIISIKLLRKREVELFESDFQARVIE